MCKMIREWLYLTSILSIISIFWTVAVSYEYEWDDQHEIDEEAGAVLNVESVLGNTINLPCNITPSADYQRVYMVFWFRENAGKPIYSFDVRGRSFNEALHWSDHRVFGSRANFINTTLSASLEIQNIQLDDEGVYRCRVDFQSAPTSNFQINLTVIVPPHQLIIYDSLGKEVNNTLEPLTEGDEFSLVCEARGGKPTPSLNWYIDKMLLSTHSIYSPDGKVVTNKLKVKGLSRWHLHKIYSCLSSNTHLIKPHHRSVLIELYLKPLEAKIKEKHLSYIAQREYEFTCQVTGSRPNPRIVWLKNGKQLTNTEIDETSPQEMLTYSKILLKMIPADNGSKLSCHANNTLLANATCGDSILLNVLYSPVVSLRYGNSLNPAKIKEGDDVYFECSVQSNPPEHKIIWYHNGIVVAQNVLSGIIISSTSLVLQSVSRHYSGTYICQATNKIGESTSQAELLWVKHTPNCISERTTIIGALIDEIVHITCKIEADPNDVKFSWYFNNSIGERYKISSKNYRAVNKTISELIYQPIFESDFGTLSCSAENELGRQTKPCLFQIIFATKPSKLKNCFLEAWKNVTETKPSHIFKVECATGYDGGLPLTFHLEIYQFHLLLSNISSEFPVFYIDTISLNVVQTTSITIILYSSNARGQSEPVMLNVKALYYAEKRTDGNDVDSSSAKKLLELSSLFILINSFTIAVLI